MAAFQTFGLKLRNYFQITRINGSVRTFSMCLRSDFVTKAEYKPSNYPEYSVCRVISGGIFARNSLWITRPMLHNGTDKILPPSICRRYLTTKSKHSSCWKCGKHLERLKNPHFCECGVVQKPTENLDYFDVLGLEKTFHQDSAKMTQLFRNLQRKLHPDRFAQKSAEEREHSADQSSLVNKAYQTLSKPLSRGLYMLELHGAPIEEGEIQLDPVFLMEIMEINEDLIECETQECLREFKEKNDVVLNDLIGKFEKALQNEQLQNAKTIMSKIKYYANIDEKIKEKEDFVD